MKSYKLGLFTLFLVSHGNSLNIYSEEINSAINFAVKLQFYLKQNNNTISPQCNESLSEYVHALLLGELWAVKMFDAGAKLPAGILDGNVVGLGSFDECLEVETERITHEKFFGKYCIGTIPIEIATKQQIKPSDRGLIRIQKSKPKVATPDGKTGIQLASCVPDSCSANEIQAVFMAISDNARFFYEELCQTKITQPHLDFGAIATLVLFGIILVIMVISTAYDIFIYYSRTKPVHFLLITFSIFSNGKKLIKINNNSNTISCLDGIRVIVTMWIILGHTYSIRLPLPTMNSFYFQEWLQNEKNMFLIGATVCVDTFFLISGLLISYSYMSSVSKKVKFNIILFYFHRYLRLTPVLATIMLVHITLLRHMGSGPLWPTVINTELINACEKYWWKTLLYVQNYGGQQYMCVPQSWYLSVDMQLFILSPLILIPLSKWPKFTLLGTGFMTLCSIIYSFLIGWFFELNMNIFGNSDPQKRKHFGDYYYFATQSRAAPWFLGIILGYYIFKIQQRKDKLIINKKLVLVLWITSLTVLLVCILAGHDLIFGEYDKLRNCLHIALVRPSWAVGIGWIIVACVFGYGGPANWFLSLPVFQILSRLTFTLYLVHYTVIQLITAQMRIPSTFNNFQQMYTFWGDFAFSFFASLILTFAIESPMVAIEELLFRRKMRKTVNSIIGNIHTKCVKTE